MADEAVTNEEVGNEDNVNFKVNGVEREVNADDSLGDSKESDDYSDAKPDLPKAEDASVSNHDRSNSENDASVDRDDVVDAKTEDTFNVNDDDVSNLKNGSLKRTASFSFESEEDIVGYEESNSTDHALEKLFSAIEKLEKEITDYEHYKGHPPNKKPRNSSPAHSATTDTVSSRPSSGMSVRSDSELVNSGNEVAGSNVTRVSLGRKTNVDLSNPLFRLPFEQGWRRELVYRANVDQNMRRQADVYYYSPAGKKLRSTREVSEHIGDSNLTVENFSFFKDALGIDDPEKEIIREAKITKNRIDSPQPGMEKSDDNSSMTEGKRTPKPKYPKGVSPEHLSTGKAKAFKVKSVGSRLGSPTALGKTNSTESASLSPKTRKSLSSGTKSPQELDMLNEFVQSPVNFTSEKNPDAFSIEKTYFGHQPTDVEASSPPKTYSSMLSDSVSVSSLKKYVAPLANPIANSIANSLINHMPLGNQINNQNSNQMLSQMNSHQSGSPANPAPNQMTGRDMCPMRCPLANIEPPSLQCSLCLCLYHNQCTGYIPSYNTSFVCKNCHLANSNIPSAASQSQPAHVQNAQKAQKSPSVSAPGTSILQRFPKPTPLVTKPPPQPRLVPVVTQVPVKSKSFNQAGSKAAKNENAPFKSAQKLTKSASDTKIKPTNVWPQEKPQTVRSSEIDPTIFPQSIAHLNGHKFIVIPKPNTVSTSPVSGPTPNPKQADNAPRIMDTVFNLASNTTITPIRHMLKPGEETKSDIKPQPFPKSLLKTDAFNTQTNVISFDNLSAEYGKYLFKQDPMLSGFPFEAQPARKPSDIVDEPKRKTRGPPVPKLIPKVMKKENGTPNQKGGRGSKTAESKNKNYFAEFYRVNQERKYNSLVQIFQYLKMRELAAAARVCRMWREIADTPALWRSVRMKNSQVNDWQGLAAALKRHGTRHLDLRKMLLPHETPDKRIWDQFTEHIAIVDSLLRIDLCRCPASVVERVCERMPQLQVLTATSVRCSELDPAPFASLTNLQELRIKGMTNLKLTSDLKCLENLTKLKHLSITSVKDLGQYGCVAVGGLTTLETLELGECTGDVGGAGLLRRLNNLTRLRLERSPGANVGSVLLRTAASLPQLQQLELINFDIKPGFEDALGKCSNVKRLLIIPTYVSQSATTNRCVLAAVLRLRSTLTHLMWGVTLELLRVTELFIDQCNRSQTSVDGAQQTPETTQQPKGSKSVNDCIPVLKPVPSLPVEESQNAIMTGRPQVEILPLPALQRLLAAELPDTRLKLLRIPFHATWRQTFNDFD